MCRPGPVQRPRPPIWLGEARHAAWLDAIVRHADGWNSTPASPHPSRATSSMALRAACERAGRDMADLELSLEIQVLVAPTDAESSHRRATSPICRRPSAAPFDADIVAALARHDDRPLHATIDDWLVGTPDEVVSQIREYLDLGISHFMLWFLDFPSLDGLRLFAEQVVPAVADAPRERPTARPGVLPTRPCDATTSPAKASRAWSDSPIGSGCLPRARRHATRRLGRPVRGSGRRRTPARQAGRRVRRPDRVPRLAVRSTARCWTPRRVLKLVGELEGDRFANRIDVEAAVERGVRVVDTTHGSSLPVAEWALALMLIGLRNAGEQFRRLIGGEEFQPLDRRSRLSAWRADRPDGRPDRARPHRPPADRAAGAVSLPGAGPRPVRVRRKSRWRCTSSWRRSSG